MFICEIDARGVWTGASAEITDVDVIPLGWAIGSSEPPPSVEADHVLMPNPAGWEIATEANLPTMTPPSPTAPVEVPMHKVWKAARLTPWGDGDLKAAIETAIGELPSPSSGLARDEWDRAPNLQRDGQTTLAVMQILGMSEQQRDELLILADSLP